MVCNSEADFFFLFHFHRSWPWKSKCRRKPFTPSLTSNTPIAVLHEALRSCGVDHEGITSDCDSSIICSHSLASGKCAVTCLSSDNTSMYDPGGQDTVRRTGSTCEALVPCKDALART